MIQRPPRMRGNAANTEGRPSGSSRETISPSGLWYINTRGGRELPVQAEFAAARVTLAPNQSLALARTEAGVFSFDVKDV